MPNRKTANEGFSVKYIGSITECRRRLVLPPSELTRMHVPDAVLLHTWRHLNAEGAKEKEGYVFWAGFFMSNGMCQVTSTIIPRGDSRYGGVKLASEEMLRVSSELQKRDCIIVAQVHSHPGRFGHSEVDEEKAVAHRPGFVSVIVPYFARRKRADLLDCHVYQYVLDGKWKKLSPEEIQQKFLVEQTRIDLR